MVKRSLRSQLDLVNHWAPELGPSARARDPQTLLVVTDANATTDKTDFRPLKWAIDYVALHGDFIRVVGVLQHRRISCSAAVQLSRTLGSFILGGSCKCQDCPRDMCTCVKDTEKKSLDMQVLKKTQMYEGLLKSLRSNCEERGVQLEVDILAGYPRKHIAVEQALRSEPAWLILDRHFRREIDYLNENVSCNLVLIKRNGDCKLIKVARSPLELGGEDKPKRLQSGIQNHSPPRIQFSPDSSDFGTTDSSNSDLSPDDSGNGPFVPRIWSMHSDNNSEDLEAQWSNLMASSAKTVTKKTGPERGLDTDVPTDMSPDIGVPQVLCSSCQHRPILRPPRPISLEELRRATNDFNEDHFLTKCGPHKVYHGFLDDCQAVSIKRFDLEKDPYSHDKFLSEINILHLVHHKNVVTLIGYCSSSETLFLDERILVYEYICNKTLAWHLSPQNPEVLSWRTRRKIALEVARGLCYLHEECRSGTIVHGLVGPENIVLTHDYMPLLCHFAEAELQPHADSTSCHARRSAKSLHEVFGTPDRYLAPEYATPTITSKADVYAYGILLLELVTGGQSVEALLPKGENSSLQAVRTNLDIKSSCQVVDPQLEDTYDMHELHCMVFAASLCIKTEVSIRPTMSKVLSILGDYDSSENSPTDLTMASLSLLA